jgi:SAM-dependent methyltransferase
MDASNGWEAIAKEFIRERDRSSIGVAAVDAWSRAFPKGAAILDLGCGPGVRRSAVLFDHGLAVYGVDASPTLAEAYQNRFPTARVACESVEESSFFGRTFDGAIACGLLFLLPAESQRLVIHRIARALNPGGRFLFTAPALICTWSDLSTGRTSWSLGRDAYQAELTKAGLSLVGEYEDEGENHYYDAVKLHLVDD